MSFFTPNTDHITNLNEKGKFLVAWRLSLIFTLFFGFVVTIVLLNENKSPLALNVVAFIIGLINLFYIKITKKYKLIFWISAIGAGALSQIAINFVLQQTHYANFLWIITSIFMAFIGINKKTGFTFLFIHLIGVFYFFLFNHNLHVLSITQKTTTELVGQATEVALALFIISYLLNHYMTFNDIANHKLEIANEELEKQNKLISSKSLENETLVKEIHHRVKNNLQIIISLLRLQKHELKTEEAKMHFSDAINRILVMSLIHQKLYQQKELSQVEIKNYLEDLANDILSLSDTSTSISINIESNIRKIGLKTIVPFGLLINELILNSLEHAFSDKSSGEISIKIKEEQNATFKVTYRDNGYWKEPDTEHKSFGLELIEILSSQLDGEYSRVIGKDGTIYSFLLHNIDLDNNNI